MRLCTYCVICCTLNVMWDKCKQGNQNQHFFGGGERQGRISYMTVKQQEGLTEMWNFDKSDITGMSVYYKRNVTGAYRVEDHQQVAKQYYL